MPTNRPFNLARSACRRIGYYCRLFGPKGVYYSAKLPNGRTRLLRVRERGLSAPIYLRSPSSDIQVYEQIFYSGEYACSFRKTPKVIIDLGANIGLFAVYCASRFPEAIIITVEPEENNFDLLKRNTQPYPNIVPMKCAVWGSNEELELVDANSGSWGFVTHRKGESGARVASAIPAMTVDRIMEAHGLHRVDIVKMDVEGAEYEVFATSTPWIESVDAMIVELHERFRPGCRDRFFEATAEFPLRWHVGENDFVARRDSCIEPLRQ